MSTCVGGERGERGERGGCEGHVRAYDGLAYHPTVTSLGCTL